ncbi:MAG: acetate kinase [Oscillospiraceae bacterium]|nr:acetate kinase [Candidatus Ruminococcus equi]
MKILVINAGSSSLKYQLIDMDTEKMIAKGNCERIGTDGSFIGHKTADGREFKKEIPMPDHAKAFKAVSDALLSEEYGVIKNLDEVSAIGHRVVQGGALFSDPELVTDEVIKGIESLIPLAPLHNKGHVQAIRGCKEVFGDDVPEVVVFDTAFHSTMPQKAYMYAVPYEYYEKYAVRRYGAHGTSHRYVAGEMAKLMGKDLKDLKLITCHIGNGSSITAIKNGKVIDTSMGLTPLDGIMMGTRSGCLDPSVVTFIAEKEGLSPEEMNELLNKKSGILGISGISSDDRDISQAEIDGDERAHLTHEMLYYQIAKYIGAYWVALGGCDGIVFTAGLGENQPQLREKVCDYLEFLGIKIDKEFNAKAWHGITGRLSTKDSSIPVELIATNEELAIARDTKSVVEKL